MGETRQPVPGPSHAGAATKPQAAAPVNGSGDDLEFESRRFAAALRLLKNHKMRDFFTQSKAQLAEQLRTMTNFMLTMSEEQPGPSGQALPAKRPMLQQQQQQQQHILILPKLENYI